MINIDFDKSKTVCVSGHRTVYTDLNLDSLKDTFINCLKYGYKNFLIGMAVGFDTICFKILYSLKKDYEFNIISCVPCKEQDKFFNENQKATYRKMLNVADKVILLSEKYTNTCMVERNKFMVDNSSLLIAYLRNEMGGTKSTVEYALKKRIDIIRL